MWVRAMVALGKLPLAPPWVRAGRRSGEARSHSGFQAFAQEIRSFRQVGQSPSVDPQSQVGGLLAGPELGA